MIILPAIDLYEGQVVRLYKGEYSQMTVYDNDPVNTARRFREAGAEYLHVVDLEGARNGTTPNYETVRDMALSSGLKIEIGGGIRSRDVIARYADIGVERVILGTAAVTQPEFVADMTAKYGVMIAVGVDIKDGFAAIKGWTETSDKNALDFCRSMESAGVKTIICTDISKDGVLGGTNLELYGTLAEKLSVNIIASGGISSLSDIEALLNMNLYGAILGKALYTGDIGLEKALNLVRARENTV